MRAATPESGTTTWPSERKGMFGDSPSRAKDSVRPTRYETVARNCAEGRPDDGRRRRRSGRLSTRKSERRQGHIDGWSARRSEQRREWPQRSNGSLAGGDQRSVVPSRRVRMGNLGVECTRSRRRTRADGSRSAVKPISCAAIDGSIRRVDDSQAKDSEQYRRLPQGGVGGCSESSLFCGRCNRAPAVPRQH